MQEDNKFAATGVIVIIVAFCLAIIVSGMIMNERPIEPVSDLTTEDEYSSISEAESISVEIRELISESNSFRETIKELIEPECTTVPTTAATTKAQVTTEPFIETTTAEAYDEYDDEYDYEEQGHSTGDYIGYFTLTAYEWTGNPMANGEYPYYGACACNRPELMGKYIYIEGHGTFKVCDTGGGLGMDTIDIYLGSPSECDRFGVQHAEVYYA